MELSPVLLLNVPSLYFKLCKRQIENKISKLKVFMLLINGWRQMERRRVLSWWLPCSERLPSAAAAVGLLLGGTIEPREMLPEPASINSNIDNSDSVYFKQPRNKSFICCIHLKMLSRACFPSEDSSHLPKAVYD